MALPVSLSNQYAARSMVAPRGLHEVQGVGWSVLWRSRCRVSLALLPRRPRALRVMRG